jgi:hypothetical protein
LEKRGPNPSRQAARAQIYQINNIREKVINAIPVISLTGSG